MQTRLDRSILGHLFDAYFPGLYRYVVFRIGDPDTSSAIAGQVFLDLLLAISKQRGPRRNLAGWLYRAAANRVQAYQEGAAISSTAALPTPIDRSDIEADTAGGGFWRQRRLQTIFQELDAEQQHILALRFSNSLSLEELTRILGKPAQVVKELQTNALKALELALQAAV